MTDKFTISYKTILNNSQKLSSTGLIEPEHIFYCLITQKGTLGNQIFKKIKISLTQAKKRLLINSQPQNRKNEKIIPNISDNSKNIIKKSALTSNKFGHSFIGTEHLLYALIDGENSIITKFLKEHKLNKEKLKEQIIFTLKTISKFSAPIDNFQLNPFEGVDLLGEGLPSEQDFLTELTEKSKSDTFDPVIGREQEIERIVEVLSCRKKNNPLLLGNPGVGKTAIIEGLSKKIAEMDVPSVLFGKKIIKLDLGSAIAGTMFRGEFEARLKQTIDKIKNDPQAILFIDEIHNIVGAGSSNSLDAANILKPALSRGEFSVIGATTPSDYKKHIENDRALLRRFKTVKIEEPSPIKSKNILKELKKYYEDFHKINVTDCAIDSAIYLSERYLPHKALPDKAIDLIDEAASRLKIKKQKHNLNFVEIEFEKRIKKIEENKKQQIAKENFPIALDLKKQEEILINDFETFKKAKKENQKIILGEITSKDIIKITSKITNIPLDNLDINNKKHLSNIENKLKTKIIGQDETIKTVTNYLKRSLLNISHPDRPLGSFIFLGPTGVGKTELSKQIANLVFGEKKSFLKLDMSEFNDKFNISRLIGAPAGYIGYEEGGKLTEFVKHNPYSLILFDEIEKAHPDIFNLLLQILEDGVLTDASGESINFKNTLIILTSNIGLKDFYFNENIGFDSSQKQKVDFNGLKEKINKNLQKKLRPELLGRLDQIITFNPLNKKDIEKITKIQLDELNERLKKQNIKLTSNTKALKHLSAISYAPEQGARAIRKTIQEKIEDELVEMMLKNKKSGIIKVGTGEVVVEM